MEKLFALSREQKNTWAPRSEQRFIRRDAEYLRIAALPRRPVPENFDVTPMTERLRQPGSSATLRPSQAWLLTEFWHAVHMGMGGALGMLPVGEGKTIPSLVASNLIGAKRPVLLVPAALKRKTEKERDSLSKDWKIDKHLRIVSNQLLQTPQNRKLLFKLMPDLFILDEAHEYANLRSARTSRLAEYCHAFPLTLVLVLSGTMTKNSLSSIMHLLDFVFPRKMLSGGVVWSNSPLPHHRSQAANDWCAVTDLARDENVDPGPLHELCTAGESVNAAVARRVRETFGVVVPPDTGSVPSSLNIFERKLDRVPDVIVDAFRQMNKTGRTLSGDQMTDSFSVWRRYREMSCGFFYRWVWKDGVVDEEWLNIRKVWRRFLRRVLQRNDHDWDSVKIVDNAVEQNLYGIADRVVRDEVLGLIYGKHLRARELRAEWQRVKVRYNPTPPKEAVWLSDYLIEDVAGFEGLIWAEHPPFAERLSAATGIKNFRPGDHSILTHRGPAIVSIDVHTKGFNFQDRWNEALYVAFPPNDERAQQSIGRIHRTGQTKDEVNIHVYGHNRALVEGFWAAKREARYNADLWKQPRKLEIATIDYPTEEDIVRYASTGSPLWNKVHDDDEQDQTAA